MLSKGKDFTQYTKLIHLAIQVNNTLQVKRSSNESEHTHY